MERMQLVAAASIVALTLGACSSGDGEGNQGEGGGSVIAYLAEPDTLDPTLSSTVTDTEVIQRLFDPLVHYNPETAEIELNGAAESYTVADDLKSITFTLREGATFHDGEPVTAEAFVRGLTRVASKDTASPVAYHLDGLVGFDELQAGEATDFPGVHEGASENELVLEFDAPNPEFIIRTGHTVFSPIPSSAEADYEAFSQAPVGNGPYKMDGVWQPNVGINVTRFEEYNGPVAGSLDSIEWKIFSEIQGGYLEFEAGSIDASSVPPESYTAAEETYGDSYLDVQLALLTFVSFHPVSDQDSPISDVHFRRAVAMAIDKEAINQAVFDGQRVAATTFIPPANTGFREGSCQYCEFDVEAAKAELEQADVPDDFVLEITFNSGAGHEDWVAAAASQIEDNLGITTKVVPGSENFGDYLDSIRGIEGMYRYGWGQDYPTPDNWLAPFYQTGAGDNYSEYSNEDVDRLLDEARTNPDEAERLRLYAEAEDIIVQDMPGIPMFYGKGAYVYSAEKFSSFPFDLQLGIPHWEGVTVA